VIISCRLCKKKSVGKRSKTSRII